MEKNWIIASVFAVWLSGVALSSMIATMQTGKSPVTVITGIQDNLHASQEALSDAALMYTDPVGWSHKVNSRTNGVAH